jgi:hypothetical protein
MEDISKDSEREIDAGSPHRVRGRQARHDKLLACHRGLDPGSNRTNRRKDLLNLDFAFLSNHPSIIVFTSSLIVFLLQYLFRIHSVY